MVMYKIDRRGGGGVQKSFSRTDPVVLLKYLENQLNTADELYDITEYFKLKTFSKD